MGGAFEPIQGYLILPANVLVALAADISFMHLPELMYAFALAVFVATVLLLVLPESRWGDLKMRSAMAVTMALVPTNPEVFGVVLYSFWWTTLWPLIVLGWKRDLWILRAPLLVVAALSSPAAGALFVVFALAYVLNRRLRDLVSAGILLAGFAFQIVIALDSTRAELLSRDADPLEVLEQTVPHRRALFVDALAFTGKPGSILPAPRRDRLRLLPRSSLRCGSRSPRGGMRRFSCSWPPVSSPC